MLTFAFFTSRNSSGIILPAKYDNNNNFDILPCLHTSNRSFTQITYLYCKGLRIIKK